MGHEYWLYRIDDEKDNYLPIYMKLKADFKGKLELCDNSIYGICRLGDDGEVFTLHTFNTSDFKNEENPVIKLTEDLNQESGLDIEVISDSISGNSVIQKQTAPNQVTNAALNSAAAKSSNMTAKKMGSDEETDEGRNNETNDVLRETTEVESSKTSEVTLSEGEKGATSEGVTATTESGSRERKEESNSKDTSCETLSEDEKSATSEAVTDTTESDSTETEDENKVKD